MSKTFAKQLHPSHGKIIKQEVCPKPDGVKKYNCPRRLLRPADNPMNIQHLFAGIGGGGAGRGTLSSTLIQNYGSRASNINEENVNPIAPPVAPSRKKAQAQKVTEEKDPGGEIVPVDERGDLPPRPALGPGVDKPVPVEFPNVPPIPRGPQERQLGMDADIPRLPGRVVGEDSGPSEPLVEPEEAGRITVPAQPAEVEPVQPLPVRPEVEPPREVPPTILRGPRPPPGPGARPLSGVNAESAGIPRVLGGTSGVPDMRPQPSPVEEGRMLSSGKIIQGPTRSAYGQIVHRGRDYTEGIGGRSTRMTSRQWSNHIENEVARSGGPFRSSPNPMVRGTMNPDYSMGELEGEGFRESFSSLMARSPAGQAVTSEVAPIMEAAPVAEEAGAAVGAGILGAAEELAPLALL